MEKIKQKLYCYVDETGQDTRGELFIVSIVVSDANKEMLADKLEKIEKISGKGKAKWMQSRGSSRLAYMKLVLSLPVFKRGLCFSLYRGTKSYMALTVLSTAKAILAVPTHYSQIVVYVDGLPKSRLRWFGTELRHLSVHNSKVRGVRREEADPFMRLADAFAGFVRSAVSDQQKDAKHLFKQAKDNEYVKEV